MLLSPFRAVGCTCEVLGARVHLKGVASELERVLRASLPSVHPTTQEGAKIAINHVIAQDGSKLAIGKFARSTFRGFRVRPTAQDGASIHLGL